MNKDDIREFVCNAHRDGGDFWDAHYGDACGWERIGFIIEDLLPAIREHKEFQEGFWDYMSKINDGTECDEGCGKTTLYYNFHKNHINNPLPRALLGYELEYIKEILEGEQA